MISSTTKGKVAATAMFLAGAVALQQSPAQASIVNSWGNWTFASETVVNSGAVSFATGQINATWAVSNNNMDPAITEATGEYFDSYSPIAQAFSVNGPSSDNNFLRVWLDAAETDVQEVITFDSPVPANKLGLAVTDIDADSVSITANGPAGDLTAAQLLGDAGSAPTDATFNFCAHRTDGPCANDTDTTNGFTNGNAVEFNTDGTSSADTAGSSAWMHPSVAVSSITINWTNIDQINPSSQRVWLVQKSDQSSTPSLAATGSNTSDQITVAGVAFVAGAAILATTRRRKVRN